MKIILLLYTLLAGCTTNLAAVPDQVDENPIRALILTIVIVAVLVFIVWMQSIIIVEKTKYKELMDDLKTFSYFVGNCQITLENKKTIMYKLKEYNSMNELSEELKNLIWKINQLYIKRFIKTTEVAR